MLDADRYTINVLDHGKVRLLDFMGDDLAVVDAAQSSFANFSTEYDEREQRILRSLMREEHGVPFEHTTLKFRLEMPIFVARQLVKHRTSSWSEKSGRYSTLDIEYYVPTVNDVRSQVGKPMEYRFVTSNFDLAQEFLLRLQRWCNDGMENYKWALESGIAREQARLFVPIGAYTTVTWTMNLRAFLNVLHLRTDPHAQAETRQYALAMETLTRQLFSDTLEAFNEFGRVAP